MTRGGRNAARDCAQWGHTTASSVGFPLWNSEIVLAVCAGCLNTTAAVGIERTNGEPNLSSSHVPSSHTTDSFETLQLLRVLPACCFRLSCFTLFEITNEKCCICNAHVFLNTMIVPEVFIAHDTMESRVYKWDEWLWMNLAWVGALCHLPARAPGSAWYKLCCRLPHSAEVCTPNENFLSALICHFL